MSKMAIKVCFVLSASVQCLLRLSQKEWEEGAEEVTDWWDDMARGSVESKMVDGAVGATSWVAVKETWSDGCARE